MNLQIKEKSGKCTLDHEFKPINLSEYENFFICECGKYARKDSFICGKWQRVEYHLNEIKGE